MKPATLVTWAFAPEWLTIEEACELSGHSLDTLHWLIEDGAVDTRHDGDGWLIEKASLREFQEVLAEVVLL
jgi:excisionase family DNA binding protein